MREREIARKRNRDIDTWKERGEDRDKAYNYVHTCRQAPAYTSIITDFNFFYET